MIVLDTNVVLELVRPSPDAAVVAWLRPHAPGFLATTAVSVAEIRYGLDRLPAGRRADDLRRLADDVLNAFPSQVLPFDVEAAPLYGEIAAARERAGQPIGALDAQIAAICRLHTVPLATRNTKDFADTGVELLDPWTS